MNARDYSRLTDILESAKKIASLVELEKTAFESDFVIQSAIERHLIIVGECAAHISPELSSLTPYIAWSDARALRNLLVHAYARTDLNIVWDVASAYIPILAEQIQKLLELGE